MTQSSLNNFYTIRFSLVELIIFTHTLIDQLHIPVLVILLMTLVFLAQFQATKMAAMQTKTKITDPDISVASSISSA